MYRFGMLCEIYSVQYFVGVYEMAELTLMLLEKGSGNNIRCWAINGWSKSDSLVSSTEKILLEIEKVKPDVVVIDLDLYANIDGIETARVIRSRFDVPVMYK